MASGRKFDIEADCDDNSARIVGHRSMTRMEYMNKKWERMREEHTDSHDSGLGSLPYNSGELSNIDHQEKSLTELEVVTESDQHEDKMDPFESEIHRKFTRLSLGNKTVAASTDNTRCDSGLFDEENVSILDSTEEENSRDFWVFDSHVPPEQIVEFFRGDEDGDNHLHLSIIHKLPAVTMHLISVAPDPAWLNLVNHMNQTPLYLAVLTRQATVVRRLVCAGAALEARDQHGNTPLHMACYLGYEDIVVTLLTPVTADECRQNRYSITMPAHSSLDIRNYEGWSPLHLAAQRGHLGIMKLLINKGANVNSVDGKSGRSVLHLAAEWGDMNMLRFLLDCRDINVNAVTYGGLTALLLAHGRLHTEAKDLLQRAGALSDSVLFSDESEPSDDEMSDDD